jgi:hypothetical protein
MTTGGWIFMAGSLCFVVTLTTWCYINLLGAKRD